MSKINQELLWDALVLTQHGAQGTTQAQEPNRRPSPTARGRSWFVTGMHPPSTSGSRGTAQSNSACVRETGRKGREEGQQTGPASIDQGTRTNTELH